MNARNLAGLLANAGLDARGKIVLVFDHEPQEDDPESVFREDAEGPAARVPDPLELRGFRRAAALRSAPMPPRGGGTGAQRAR